MRPKTDHWTIVVAGGWNVRVFSPEWVGRNLIPEKPLNVEVPLVSPVQQLRFIAGGVVLIPGEDRLIVGVQEPSIANMAKAEAIALRAVELLSHTPMGAVGVNFGFETLTPTDQLTRLFRVADISALSGFGATVLQTKVVRRLAVDGETLNITHTLADGAIEVHMNFHRDASSAEEVSSALSGCSERSLGIATRLLSDVYGVAVEQEAANGEAH